MKAAANSKISGNLLANTSWKCEKKLGNIPWWCLYLEQKLGRVNGLVLSHSQLLVKLLQNKKILDDVTHCWKYFSPRSNFGTKNPKLGSDNPFILSVNFENHLDLVCQFLDWQWSKLLDKGSNNRIPNSKYMTIVALIQ